MIGLYVHVPFCAVRCSYCDFYLVPARGRDLGAYADALVAEIEAFEPPVAERAADTVHFGGGTPSLLPASLLARVLNAVGTVFDLAPRSEIALEANPEDVRPETVAAWREAGITRLAIGVQTLDDEELGRLRRTHTSVQALAALRCGRASGIPSLAADLILGLPGRMPTAALADIERVVEAGADHVSIYLLELHARTRLGRAVALGRAATPDPDAVADLYERATGLLASLGLEAYEISNFARPGHQSRHNLKYWTDEDYVGFGPSAHSYLDGRRRSNPADLRGYLASGGRGLPRLEEPHEPERRAAEALCAGLRLAAGVDLGALRRRHGDVIPSDRDPRVTLLEEAGLLERERERLRLTARGRLVSNEVLERLLPGAPPPAAASALETRTGP